MAWSISLSLSESNVSTVNNTSVVTATLSISWNYESHANDNPTYSITIDGDTYTGTANFNTGIAWSGSQVVATASKTVTHDSNTGKKTVYASAGYAGSGTGWQTASASKELTEIKRKSTLTVASGSVTADGSSSIKISVTKKSTSFTDTLKFTLGSNTQTISLSGSGTSYTGYLIVPETWAQQFTTAKSKIGTLTLTTKSGSTTIGTSTATITVNVKSYSPSVSAVLTPVSTPSTFSSLSYVQSLSKVNVVTTASGYQGSTISSYSVTIENTAYSGADITSALLANSGSQNVIVKVTDSRGVTGTETYTISVTEYHSPIVAVAAQCSTAENKSVIAVSFNVSAVGNLNAKDYVLYGTWTDTSGTTHTLEQLGSGTFSTYSGTLTLYHNSIDPTLTYKYRVTVTDSVGSVYDEVETGIIAISRYRGGKGVAFGQNATESEKVVINPDWDLKLKGSTMADFIVEQGTSGDWTYRKWHSGIYECWCETSINGTWNTWGSLYYLGMSIHFPVTFDDVPVVDRSYQAIKSSTLTKDSMISICSYHSLTREQAKSMCSVALFRPTTGDDNVDYTVRIYVIGKKQQ